MHQSSSRGGGHRHVGSGGAMEAGFRKQDLRPLLHRLRSRFPKSNSSTGAPPPPRPAPIRVRGRRSLPRERHPHPRPLQLYVARGPSSVSRDRAAAENAIDPRSRSYDTPFRDPGVVESRIPRDDFDRLFAPFEREYGGFFPNPIRSTEIPTRSPEQFDVFNRHRVR